MLRCERLWFEFHGTLIVIIIQRICLQGWIIAPVKIRPFVWLESVNDTYLVQTQHLWSIFQVLSFHREVECISHDHVVGILVKCMVNREDNCRGLPFGLFEEETCFFVGQTHRAMMYHKSIHAPTPCTLLWILYITCLRYCQIGGFHCQPLISRLVCFSQRKFC